MKRRQLTKQEKKLNENAIKRMEKEIENAEYMLQIENLKIEKGHRLVYEANMQESKKKVSFYKDLIKTNQEKIKILKEQNEKGVIPKKAK